STIEEVRGEPFDRPAELCRPVTSAMEVKDLSGTSSGGKSARPRSWERSSAPGARSVVATTIAVPAWFGVRVQTMRAQAQARQSAARIRRGRKRDDRAQDEAVLRMRCRRPMR